MTDSMPEAPVQKKRPGGRRGKKKWFSFMQPRNQGDNALSKKFVRKNYGLLSENILEDSGPRSLRNRSRIFKPKVFSGYVDTLEVLADINKERKCPAKTSVLNDEVPDFGNADSESHLQKLFYSGCIKISKIGYLNKSRFSPRVYLIPLVGNGESFSNSSSIRSKRKIEPKTAHGSQNKRLKSSNSSRSDAPESKNNNVISHNTEIKNKSGKMVCDSSPLLKTIMKQRKQDINLYRRSVYSRQRFLEAITCYIDDKKYSYQNNVPMKDTSAVKCPHRLLTLTPIFRPTSFILGRDHRRERQKSAHKLLVDFRDEKSNVACGDELSKDYVANSKIERSSDCKQCEEAFKTEEQLLHTLYYRFSSEIPSEILNEIKRRKKSILKRILLQKWDMELDALFVYLENGTIATLYGETKDVFLKLARKKRSQMYGNLELSENEKCVGMPALKESVLVVPQPSIVNEEPYGKCTESLTESKTDDLTIKGQKKVKKKKTKIGNGAIERQTQIKKKKIETVDITGDCQRKENKSTTDNVRIERQIKAKETKIDCRTKINKANNLTVVCQTKQKETKIDEERLYLEEMKLLDGSPNDRRDLLDSVQMVECSLPLAEAMNRTTLQQTCLFRQTFKSFDSLIQCFFCRNKHELLYLYLPLHLKKHYETKHQLTVHMCAAKYNTDSEFITVSSQLKDETVLDHACVYCDSKLRNRADVNQHYSDVHKKTVVLVAEEELASLEEHVYCCLCNHPSKNLHLHRLHMVKEHAARTYFCLFCSFCTYHYLKLTIHLRKIHDTKFNCTVCDILIKGQRNIRQHIIGKHVVKTGSDEWFCSLCLEPFRNLDELVMHVRECTDNAPALSSKSSNQGVGNCTTPVSCENNSLTINPEKTLAEKTANIDEKHACFLCDRSFSSLVTYEEHIHHVHKKWVKRKVASKSAAVDPPKKHQDESKKTTLNNRKSSIDAEVRTSSTEENLDSGLPNDESSENRAESVTTGLSSAVEASQKDSQPSIQAEEISNSTPGCLKSNAVSNTQSTESGDSQDNVSLSSLSDDQQLLKIGFPEKVWHFCDKCNVVSKDYLTTCPHYLSSTKENLDCVLPYDESSENRAESVTSRLSSAVEASQKDSQPSIQAEEISNSTPGCLKSNAVSNTQSTESGDLQDNVSLSSLPDDQQLLKIGFPEKVWHFCDKCDVVIKDYRLYYLHMHNLHQMKKMFRCSVSSCCKIFDAPSDFEAHAQKHSQKGTVFCRLCDMVFASEEEKVTHLLTPVHQFLEKQKKKKRNSGNYSCKVCYTMFYFHQSFVEHMETESHQYVCHTCNTLFVQFQQRRRHIESCHPALANTCEVCSMQFPNVKSVLKHLAVHDYIFQCSVCGSQFFQKEQFDVHSEIHGKQLLCPVNGCKQWFSFGILNYYLFHHLRNFHKLFEDLTCPPCSLVCKYDFQLYKHWTFENNIFKCSKDGSVISVTPPERKLVQEPILVEENRSTRPKKSQNVQGISKVTHASVMNTLSVKPTYRLSKVNVNNNVQKTTLNDSIAWHKKLPQIVRLEPNRVLLFNFSKVLTDRNESSNSLPTINVNENRIIMKSMQNPATKVFLLNEDRNSKCPPSETKDNQQLIESNADKNMPVLTVKQEPAEEPNQFIESNVDENQPVLTVKEEPVEESIELDEDMALRFVASEKPTETGQQFTESNVDKNLPIVTIKQEPVEEEIHVDENRASEKPTEAAGNWQADVDKNLPVGTVIKQEPMEESIPLDQSRTLSLESSAKSSEVVRTSKKPAKEILQVLTTVKQEPLEEECIEPNGGTAIGKSMHLTVNQEQRSVVLEESMQATKNVSGVQLDFNKEISDQIAGQSVPSGKTFMNIPVEMIQLACAGCLCMFESKDDFLDHVCTGQIADDAAGRIVVVPEDGSNTGTAEWVGQATVSEQLVSTNHPVFSDSSILQSLDEGTVLPYVKHFLGGQLQIVPIDKKNPS